MTNTELNALIETLRTPVDFSSLHAKANKIKADLDRIGSELDKLDSDLEAIKSDCEAINARLKAGPSAC